MHRLKVLCELCPVSFDGLAVAWRSLDRTCDEQVECMTAPPGRPWVADLSAPVPF